MSIRKKHISRYYTIVEVMVAMGIFLVMMTIMMQFFNSAQKVWNSASKRNFMYADARVAMNVMTREIQSMLYDNDAVDDMYPFWFEWTDMDVDTGGVVPELSTVDNYNVDYLTALNFIANTDLKSEDAVSDICEIRYKFIPVYFDATASVSNAKGGKLLRSYTKETDPANSKYNFQANLYGTSDRVKNIWEDSSSDGFETVITGVYSLRFTCYVWDSGLKLIKPLDINGVLKNNGGFAYSGNLVTGTPMPVAIRIDMKLMDPKDFKRLAFAIKESNTKQIKNLKQKMRTFSKVIYLGISE